MPLTGFTTFLDDCYLPLGTKLATEDLADWSHPSVYQVDPAAGICALDFDPVSPKMFFKYSIWVYDN